MVIEIPGPLTRALALGVQQPLRTVLERRVAVPDLFEEVDLVPSREEGHGQGVYRGVPPSLDRIMGSVFECELWGMPGAGGCVRER
jgi:hypothetical protein